MQGEGRSDEGANGDFESESKGDHLHSKVIIKSDDHLITFRF